MVMSDRAWLRLIFSIFTVLTAVVSSYLWTTTSSATDFDVVYRFMLPIASASFLWAAIRPSISGITLVFMPLTIAAGLRVVDFMQDWYVSPERAAGLRAEEPDVWTRVGLASFGWSAAAVFNLLVWRFEVMMSKLADSQLVCFNADTCPNRRPPSQPHPVGHRLRSVLHLGD